MIIRLNYLRIHVLNARYVLVSGQCVSCPASSPLLSFPVLFCFVVLSSLLFSSLLFSSLVFSSLLSFSFALSLSFWIVGGSISHLASWSVNCLRQTQTRCSWALSAPSDLRSWKSWLKRLRFLRYARLLLLPSIKTLVVLGDFSKGKVGQKERRCYWMASFKVLVG